MSDPKNKNSKDKKTLSRRDFLGGTIATTAAFTIVPRHVLGGNGYTAPNDKLNIGCVGVGGKGTSDTLSVSTENIVAMCDVDDLQMARFEERTTREPESKLMFEKAKKYRD